jgi:hypothetical protein
MTNMEHLLFLIWIMFPVAVGCFAILRLQGTIIGLEQDLSRLEIRKPRSVAAILAASEARKAGKMETASRKCAADFPYGEWFPIGMVPEELKRNRELVLLGRVDELYGDLCDVGWWHENNGYPYWRVGIGIPTHWARLPPLPNGGQ